MFLLEKLKPISLIIIGLIFFAGLAISNSHDKFFEDDAVSNNYHIFDEDENLIPAMIILEETQGGGILVNKDDRYYAIIESQGVWNYEVYKSIFGRTDFQFLDCFDNGEDYLVAASHISKNSLTISDILPACSSRSTNIYQYTDPLGTFFGLFGVRDSIRTEILKYKNQINNEYKFAPTPSVFVPSPVDPTPAPVTQPKNETCSISVASNAREFFLANTLGHPDYPAGLHSDDFKSGTYIVKSGSSYRRHPSSVFLSGADTIAKFDDLECGATYKFYWDFDTPNGRIYFEHKENGAEFYAVTATYTANSGTGIDGSFGSKHKVIVGPEHNLCEFGLRVAASSVGQNKLEENFDNIVIRNRNTDQLNRDYRVQSNYRNSSGLSYVFALDAGDYYFEEKVTGQNKRFPSSGFLRVKKDDNKCTFFKVA